jgi:starch synthase
LNMQVGLGSPGRFHTFDLARQLSRLNVLDRVYTGYPANEVTGVPPENCKTFPWVISPMMLFGRWGWTRAQHSLERPAMTSFDAWLSRTLRPCSIFHCLSGFGIKAHQTARERYGAFTICDRGSSHALYQKQILEEEHRKWGAEVPEISQLALERELREYEYCDSVVVPSSFVFRTFVESGVSPQKIAKISYGVDLSLFRKVAKTDNVFRVLFVGSISVRKGVPYLIEALASLRLPDFEVWLAGSVHPSMTQMLKDRDLPFKFLGTVPRTRLSEVYSQCSVLVLPSVEEGLALVQAQAMACGLPVIATPNTGAEDLYTHGVEGFIVPIRDPRAIREHVLKLYEDPSLRDQMADAALRRVQNLGGWDAYGAQMVAHYQSKAQRN